MILDLDPLFHPYPHLEAIQFESFVFAGGEPHIKIQSELSRVSEVVISHRIRSFSDVGQLLVAIDALRRMGIRDLRLFLPYFPGARQDRVMTSGEALTAKIYARILNGAKLREVSIYDPHSDVVPALLDYCQTFNNHSFVKWVLEDIPGDPFLVAPDGGALKKVYKLAAKFPQNPIVECGKRRDVSTGRLSEFKVYADDLMGRDCLIVDDICDGGGTFLGLSQALRNKNAGKIYLAVSHGIFSRGLQELKKQFRKIYCTDAFSTLPESDRFEQIQLNQILN